MAKLIIPLLGVLLALPLASHVSAQTLPAGLPNRFAFGIQSGATDLLQIVAGKQGTLTFTAKVLKDRPIVFQPATGAGQPAGRPCGKR